MKVIIAGTRTIKCDPVVIRFFVNQSGFNITELVCGKAKGIDSSGDWWAKVNNIPIKEFPADWDTHGKSAGSIRNEEMAKYAEALILIWDGKSTGSFNMLLNAKKHNLPVYSVMV